MSNAIIRRELKKAIDNLQDDRLASVADYIAFLNRPTLKQRIQKAEVDFKAGKGIDWRKVRDVV